jgi:hypothetical protein
MGTPKFIDPHFDIALPVQGQKVAAYICMFGHSDDVGDHILRVEAVACAPAARVILGFQFWDMADLKDTDPADLVILFCSSHGVTELQFAPELLPVSAASTGTCQHCGALNVYVPWRRDAALW